MMIFLPGILLCLFTILYCNAMLLITFLCTCSRADVDSTLLTVCLILTKKSSVCAMLVKAKSALSSVELMLE